MAVFRDNPYPAFNFIVALGDAQGSGDLGAIVGGFSDVSGLGMEVKYSEYRNGNDKVSTVRKVPNTHTVDDVTLKRGVDGTVDPRTVTTSMMDEGRQDTVATFTLRRAQPKKWTGPTMAAKGGADVAMEELVLVHEGIEYS